MTWIVIYRISFVNCSAVQMTMTCPFQCKWPWPTCVEWGLASSSSESLSGLSVQSSLIMSSGTMTSDNRKWAEVQIYRKKTYQVNHPVQMPWPSKINHDSICPGIFKFSKQNFKRLFLLTHTVNLTHMTLTSILKFLIKNCPEIIVYLQILSIWP